jgi:hypothetical protein
MLARAIALSLMDSIEFPTGHISPEGNRETSQDTKIDILELANTLQDILGEAMATATTMFPHKVTPPPTRGTLPRHLWPNSVRHDVSEIRSQAKAVRRLVRIEANPPATTPDKPSLLDTHPALWSNGITPIQLRTSLSFLPRGLDTLSLLAREKLHPNGENLPSQAIQAYFTGFRKESRLLLKHARSVRRLKYGKFLLRLFAKKPNMALRSILRISAGNQNTNTLPTDLSIIKDEASGLLTTNAPEVVKNIAELETIALSLDPTLPPGVPFPWLSHVRPTPTSSVPMIAG